jgi:hypothetical protein
MINKININRKLKLYKINCNKVNLVKIKLRNKAKNKLELYVRLKI